MIVVMIPLNELLKPRERCFISALKKMLGDYDPNCPIYQDMALLCFLQFSLNDINAHPTPSWFELDNWPYNWDALLLQGAQIQAMCAQALFEQGKEFEINDNGIVISPPPVSANLRELHSTVLQTYENRKEIIKANYRPAGGAGLGSTKVYGYGITKVMMDRMKRAGRLF